ncbi:hypothetical protein LCGC14_2238240 [marine sediment metagenome]|uniref:Uncharacterized protein n=1 Tax=marine sediment metagenome TaxID=412755 RepID=A0A0F9DTS3_9ZZZZ
MCAVGNSKSVGSFGYIIDPTTIVWPDRTLTKFLRKLIHSCDIEQDTGTDTNTSGKRIADWNDHLTGVFCLFEGYGVRDERSDENVDSAKVVVEKWNLMLPAGTTIEVHRFRVGNITRRSDSVVLEEGPLYIQEVNHVDSPKQAEEHHVECVLKRLN